MFETHLAAPFNTHQNLSTAKMLRDKNAGKNRNCNLPFHNQLLTLDNEGLHIYRLDAVISSGTSMKLKYNSRLNATQVLFGKEKSNLLNNRI